MKTEHDPFHHHPELRDKISDPMKSYFRDFDVVEAFGDKPEFNWVMDLLYSEGEREESRLEALAERMNDDIWVFAYGSLMWDPAIIFAEVRRAFVPEYSRRFILKDIWGGRGTNDLPGLMAALDKGAGCEGLAYRISKDKVDAETKILWSRERVGPGYKPVFVTANIDGENIDILTFVADYQAENIQAELSRALQVEYLATGNGFLGTSYEYLEGIVKQFATLGIVDEDCSALLLEVDKHIAE